MMGRQRKFWFQIQIELFLTHPGEVPHPLHSRQSLLTGPVKEDASALSILPWKGP